ncbi:MAG: Bro-N domain-containing protein [Paludibacteraceae bacterium]|nr:Bro-N domain-containing protein [Paludibacteraceae bacterium]
MAIHDLVKLFDQAKIRVVWDDEKEKYYFSVVDVVGVLTEQQTARNATVYWAVMKKRLKEEGAAELITNCKQLKLVANDGKRRETDVADLEGIFRIIQSIPSKKAEPVKRWLAQVGSERFYQLQDPERSIEQAVKDYRRLGYSENWINQRIKTIEIRKGLTDEWKRSGVESDSDYAVLTDLMSKVWSGMTTREYKHHKGLTSQNLRDNMTNMELLLNALAEQTATDLSKERNPEGIVEAAHVAKDGAEVARNARADIEQRLGHSVISSDKAIDHIKPQDELPFEKDDK